MRQFSWLRALILTLRKSEEKCVCFTTSGTRLITFHKAWDKTILPMPFSRVLVDFAQPMEIPLQTSEDEMEKIRQEVEDALNELTDRVDEMCGYKQPVESVK